MATTITTFKKARLGVEDIHLDADGSSATAQTPTSAGGTRTVRKINSSHIPVTTTTRAKTDAAGVTLTETNVDTVLQQLLTDNAAQGIPDNSTIEVSSGVLRIKDAGVATAKIATSAVTTAKIADDAVTIDKIADDAVGASQLKDDASVDANRAVTTNHIRDSAVTTAKLNDGAVTNVKITDASIKAAKMLDTPSHFTKLAGSYSWAGGATSIAATITGVLTTDTIIAVPKSLTNAVYLRSASPTASDQVTFTFSADPGASVIFYHVLRAVTA